MAEPSLLDQLRIDRSAPPSRRGGPGWRAPALALAVVLALIAAAAWWWLQRGIEVEAVVATAPARGAQATAVLQATGYVVARREATVSAQITGTLTDVLIEEGEHVAAGQVLAHLDDTAQRAALAQAEAGLVAARAQLAQVQAQIGQSRRDLARAEDLLARGLVAVQATELARTQLEGQQAQAGALRAQVQVAEAAVEGARVQLGYCTVRAPFAGVVVAKAAQVGEIVSPLSAGGGFTRTGVGTIVDMESLEVEVDVNESYIKRVEAGQPTTALLDAYPDWNIPGHVIAIIPTADRSKATVKVRVALAEKDARIVPDMGVRVSFLEPGGATGTPPEAPPGVLLPASAVVTRGGREAVFTADGERARLLPVQATGPQGGQRRVQGIEVGTRIVRNPPEDLEDGSRIRQR